MRGLGIAPKCKLRTPVVKLEHAVFGGGALLDIKNGHPAFRKKGKRQGVQHSLAETEQGISRSICPVRRFTPRGINLEFLRSTKKICSARWANRILLCHVNTMDQLLIRTGILRRLCRLRAASTIVSTDCQNQRYFIPLPCWRMELSGGRTRWVRSNVRGTKNPDIITMSGFFGDPYGNRTHVTAVKGRCLNRLTNGPGSGNLTRTDDTPGMNRMLYQLSYAAIYCCVSQQEILYRQSCDLSTTFVWIFRDFRKFFLPRQPIRPKRRPGRGPRRAHGGADYADLRPRRRP